jgi:DNA-directed RNA polymerase specialized sigma24 family protein
MNEPPVASTLQTTAAKQADRLSALFEAHADRLYRLARRLAPHTDEALDLVQETFLKAARSPGSIPYGSTSEEAWLVRVLINVRRDRWRKETVRRRFLSGQHVLQHPDPERELLVRTTVWSGNAHRSTHRDSDRRNCCDGAGRPVSHVRFGGDQRHLYAS